MHGGTRTGVHTDIDHTRVFLRQQTCRRDLNKEDEERHSGSHDAIRHVFMSDERRNSARVFILKNTEHRIESTAEAGSKVVLLITVLVFIGPQQESAQGGRQRHGVDKRDAYSHRHGETELAIESTRRTSHHAHRNEHSHEDQRRGD